MCDMIDKWWFQTIRKKHLFHRTIRQIPMNPPGTPNKKKNRGTLGPRCHYIPKAIAFVTPKGWSGGFFTEMPQSAIHPPCHWHACGRSTILWWSPAGEMESLRLGGFHWCNFGAAKWKDLWRRLSRFFPWQSIHGNRLGLDGLYIYNIFI